jgi:hypothetical protein
MGLYLHNLLAAVSLWQSENYENFEADGDPPRISFNGICR